MSGENIWLARAVKLQSIAQAELTYGKDKFDIERYEEIRKISTEIVAHKTELPLEKVLAVQDREKHNKPVYAWKICKIFILCSIKKDGKFTANIETTESKYFSLEEISKLNLAEEKNNLEQIKMCFVAYENKNWQTQLD